MKKPEEYSENNSRGEKRRKGRAAGWAVLMLLCLMAAGIVYLRGTVTRDDRQMPEIPQAVSENGSAAAQPAQTAGEAEPQRGAELTAGSEAEEGKDRPVPDAASSSSGTQSYTQPAARTPAPVYQPPVYYPAQEADTETEQDDPAPVNTPAPAASPVPAATPAPSPSPGQNGGGAEPLIITLEENELPLF